MTYELSQIQKNISQFVFDINVFNQKYAALFDTMHTFGFRIGEVTEENRWDLSTLPVVTILTEKKSNDRTFASKDFNGYVQEALDKGLFPFPYTSNSVASYFIKRYYPVKQIHVQSKIITTHIFRHAKFKQLYNDGYTVSEISMYMGEVDEKNTLSYINSEIWI